MSSSQLTKGFFLNHQPDNIRKSIENSDGSDHFSSKKVSPITEVRITGDFAKVWDVWVPVWVQKAQLVNAMLN